MPNPLPAVPRGAMPWLVLWCFAGPVVIALAAGSIDLAVYLRAAEAVAVGSDPFITPPGALPWLYPPVAALAFVPLTRVPFPVASVIVALGPSAALARTVHLVGARLVPGRPELTVVATATAVVTEPVASTLGHGQVNLAVAWLVTEGFLGRRRWLIGVAAGLKLTPLVFLLPLIVRRQGRGVVQVLAGFTATAVIGALVAPGPSLGYWAGAVADVSGRVGLGFATNQSLTGMAWQLAPDGGAPMLVGAASAVVVALGVVIVRRAGEDDVLSLAVTGLVGCLVSPISWTHHWVWTLPLVAWLLCQGSRLLAFAWGGLLVTWVVWWSEDATVASLWTLVAVATLIALSGEPRQGVRGRMAGLSAIRREKHDRPQRARHPLRVAGDARDLEPRAQDRGRA